MLGVVVFVWMVNWRDITHWSKQLAVSSGTGVNEQLKWTGAATSQNSKR